MEKKEFAFAGVSLNGILMLVLSIALSIGSVVGIIWSGINMDEAETLGNGQFGMWSASLIGFILLLLLSIVMLCGFIQVEPGEARVMMFFGKYRGTFTTPGFYWVNPFISTKKLSLRARNLDAEPIKVNDKAGNPVMIGLVLVWKLRDTYKAMFEVDTQTMAAAKAGANQDGHSAAIIMTALQNFVSIQADAALRQVAGQYAYDNEEDERAITLRDGSEEVNEELETKISERLEMAGIEVVEARINYLAYAPEIAAVMLRRQQATAIIAAREKIVEGAVSMVKMALDKLSAEQVVELDDERKAAMVSNLLVVLCGDDNAQPVVNTGSLYN